MERLVDDVGDEISKSTLNIANIHVQDMLPTWEWTLEHFSLRVLCWKKLDDIVVVVERLVDDVGDEISQSTLNTANIHVQDNEPTWE